MLAASAASANVTIHWSTVGNPGNQPDPTTGFGAVDYAYRIGTFEVTNAQYAAFLNAVAASDPFELYNTEMGNSARGGIIRSGTDGSFTYTLKPNMANKPINFVSWYDAARMANWMTNGQGAADTESGVYTLTFPDDVTDITRDPSNPDQVFIPTEDEWYKAAYHQPANQGGDTDDYWLYATQSNADPTFANATLDADVFNPGQNTANYNSVADWNGQNGNVTTVGSAGSATFYGTYDMNGNVREFNETLIGTSARGARGGSFRSARPSLASSDRNSSFPPNESRSLGFRLASPAPTEQPCPADTDTDGTVNPDDLFLLLANFGNTCN